MIPQAEQLLDRARSGQRLTTSERRHCVSYNMVKAPEVSNVAMAELFGVSERQVRLDKQHIRQERAKLVKEDDVGLVIADIAMAFENEVQDIQHSKSKCKAGSRDYLEHCRAIFTLQLAKVKALQDLGYYPKNLGNMTIDRYEYKSVVAKDGSVNTRPVNLQLDAEDDKTGVDSIEFVQPARLIEGAR